MGSASGSGPGSARHCCPEGEDPEGDKPWKSTVLLDIFVKLVAW